LKWKRPDVTGVGLLKKHLAEAGINAVAVGEGAKATVVLDAAALANAEENDAVNDALNGEVEFALGKLSGCEGELRARSGAQVSMV